LNPSLSSKRARGRKESFYIEAHFFRSCLG
jgi:hypothetical protein